MSQSHCCEFCGICSNDSSAFLSPLPTPIAAPLLSSNDTLTIHDKITIKGQLSRIQAGLDTIDNAITNLQKARAELEYERLKYAGLVSPFRAFPPELLSEIFLVYSESWLETIDGLYSKAAMNEWKHAERSLSGGSLKGHVVGWGSTRPVRVVSQVCRSWRAAAYGCSELWSNLYVNGLDALGNVGVAQSLLSDQLHFSSAHPLRINISLHRGSLVLDRNENYLFLLSQYIVPAHHRWMSVKIALTDNILRLLPKPSVTPLFPSLVSLSIRFWGFSGIHELSAADVPLLTEVSLEGNYGHPHTGIFRLPWAQLRKLQLATCTGSVALATVRDLRNVEELALLKIHDLEELPNLPQGDLTLPFLRRLAMSDSEYGDTPPATLLCYLRLPALKTLCWTQIKNDDVPYLDMMLEKTWPDGSPGLTELYLHSPHQAMHEGQEDDENTHLTRLLDSIGPQVQTIEIVYPNSSGVDLSFVVTRLVSFIETGSMPNLRTFKLQGVVLDCLDMSDLLPFGEHNVDVWLVKCAFGVYELYHGRLIASIIRTLQRSPPPKGYLELDIEGPDSKRLTYSPQNGLKIEEPHVQL